MAHIDTLPEAPNRTTQQRRVCTRCLYDADTPAIVFDSEGVCNYCKMSDSLADTYPNDERGDAYLQELANLIRKDSSRRKYDVVVGVSGGCDSSWMIYKTIELGLRPLAVHFDNTWNSTIATENIYNVLKAFDVDLFTYVVDNEEYDDIYRSFLQAGVPDIEAPTDIGLATVLYKAAEAHGIKYIFEGHSFRTEGVSPLGWLYMDARYIQSVHRRYGRVPMKTFPNLWMKDMMRWMAFRRIKKIRPLYYMDYRKEEAKEMLASRYNWKWYGGHHLENRFTAFYHSYFLPRRFGIDQRVNGYAAMVRNGQMSREEGMRLLSEAPEHDPEIVALVKKRLGYSDAEFESLMQAPHHSYREFKTYKPTFERMRPVFKVMADLDLIPRSFYIKYTSRSNI